MLAYFSVVVEIGYHHRAMFGGLVLIDTNM